MYESIKNQVKDLLEQREYDRLADFCDNDKNFWKELLFRLYDTDERLCFRAIEAVAQIMLRRWQSGQQEKVREYIRHLF